METTATVTPADTLTAAREFIASHDGYFDVAFAARAKATPEVRAMLERWNTHRKGCGCCGLSTQLSELRDVPGDFWISVCRRCQPRFGVRK
jgi:hypothetical protein